MNEFNNKILSKEIVDNIVKDFFHNPDSEWYEGDPSIKPSVENQLYNFDVYGDMTEYQRQGIRYATGALVTPEWCKTQIWYKRLWADAVEFNYEDEEELEIVNIQDWDKIPVPQIVISACTYGNVGFYMLFNMEDDIITVYNPGNTLEYNYPAFNGIFSEQATEEITEWCDNILQEIEQYDLKL